MYMDYLFYLNTLTRAEKNKQIMMFILFWIIMFIVAIILEKIITIKNKSKI